MMYTGFERMLKKHLVFSLAYALIFVLVLAADYWHLTLLNYLVRPCISIMLIVFLCLTTKLKGRFHQRLFTGLVFAFTGDTLLLMLSHHASYFLSGMIAFILCHLFYISAFYLDFRSAQELDKKGAKTAIISCAVIFTAFYLYLRPHLPLLKLPVLACVFIGALLTMMAAFRNQRVNPLSFKMIFTGILFFILTDGLMAQIHFIASFEHASLLMSATYMIAQYLIVMGGVERKLVHTQTPQ